MSTLTPDTYLSRVRIDLEAVAHNFRQIRGHAASNVRVFSVVKADAYGHGAPEVARVLEREGADMLCVARIEEALALREAGIQLPILVFTPMLAPQAALAVPLRVAASVASAEHAAIIAAAARAAGQVIPVHLKCDTGMGRLGCTPADALPLARVIASEPSLHLEGVFSHFPNADMKPPTQTIQQTTVFAAVRESLRHAGFERVLYHICNSAGALDFPEAHFDAIRPGIVHYGQYPSAEVLQRLDLRPAMTLTTTIVQVKAVPAGTPISYAQMWVAKRPTIVATVSLGYADGYSRHASNRTIMLVQGHPAPVLGRVCMDQTMIDVSALPKPPAIGETALVFGRLGDHFLPADAVAAAFGTVGYEVTTRIGRRLPRYY